MGDRDTRKGTDSDVSDGPPAEAITGSPEEMYELGGRLLEARDAQRAAGVFAAALGQLGAGRRGGEGPALGDAPGSPADAAEPVRGELLTGLGIARLEQAIAAFGEAAESADPGIRPLAVELLARVLPLRDRGDEAARVWRRGLEDPDPDVAAAVHARLWRSFGRGHQAGSPGGRAGTAGRGPAGDAGETKEISEVDDIDGVDGTGRARSAGWADWPDEGAAREGGGAGSAAGPCWWDGFLESAVCHGTLPLLADELFGALDHMYALVAVPCTRRGARARELRGALAEAVRLPGGYAWGAELRESFRGRLREALGAASDVLPPGWPDS